MNTDVSYQKSLNIQSKIHKNLYQAYNLASLRKGLGNKPLEPEVGQ